MKIIFDLTLRMIVEEHTDGSARLLKQHINTDADKIEQMAEFLEYRGVIVEIRRKQEDVA